MKQRGGSIITPKTVFYIVAFVAVFNVVAFMHLGDWSSIAVFVLAGVVTFSVTSQSTLALGVGVVAASLFRTTNVLHLETLVNPDTKDLDTKLEMKPAEKKAAKPEQKKPAPHEKESTALSLDSFTGLSTEGMTEQIGMLQKHQEAMTESMKALQPLMAQASKLLKTVDPAILKGAFKSLGKNGHNLALNL